MTWGKENGHRGKITPRGPIIKNPSTSLPHSPSSSNDDNKDDEKEERNDAGVGEEESSSYDVESESKVEENVTPIVIQPLPTSQLYIKPTPVPIVE